jgi:hypothetical protein
VGTGPLEPVDLAALSEHDLLADGLEDQVRENFYAAQRLARLEEFRARQEAQQEARKADEPHFVLTPLQETVIEAGELWGLSEGRLRSDLRTVRTLQQHFPDIWALCRSGALDSYKASLVAETAKFALDRPEQFATFSDRMTRWLRKAIPAGDDGHERPRLVNRTVKQLRNKINYELNKLKPKDADEAFKRGFSQRSARPRLDEDGMGSLCLTHTVADIQTADYRLTLIAKALRANGDERTIDQLRADLAVDLIIGRVQLGASVAELEHAETGDRSDPVDTVHALPTSGYARPVVNVTVPIQTLMGLSDHPAVLSGGSVIPATLARLIAADPDSTWYRMLTDPARRMTELSTKSYHPTPPIWREMVARYNTCYRRNCDRPATTSEGDHLEKWPRGATSSTNLGPACKPDHKGKHSRGFSLENNGNGSVTLRTRAGFSHTTDPVEQPSTSHWPDAEIFENQYTATELLDAVRYLRARDAAMAVQLAADLDEDERWMLSHAS